MCTVLYTAHLFCDLIDVKHLQRSCIAKMKLVGSGFVFVIIILSRDLYPRHIMGPLFCNYNHNVVRIIANIAGFLLEWLAYCYQG